MTKFVGQGEKEDSPDLLDSGVWALWDLFLDPMMPPPRAGDDWRRAGADEHLNGTYQPSSYARQIATYLCGESPTPGR